jgi:hypothetical protein
LDALVVVVHSHAEDPLGVILTDHVLVEVGHDLARGQQIRDLKVIARSVRDVFVNQQTVAQFDTVIADKDTIRASNQSIYLVMMTTAERTAMVTGWYVAHVTFLSPALVRAPNQSDRIPLPDGR